MNCVCPGKPVYSSNTFSFLYVFLAFLKLDCSFGLNIKVVVIHLNTGILLSKRRVY